MIPFFFLLHTYVGDSKPTHVLQIRFHNCGHGGLRNYLVLDSLGEVFVCFIQMSFGKQGSNSLCY